jgi:hypothetical protein
MCSFFYVEVPGSYFRDDGISLDHITLCKKFRCTDDFAMVLGKGSPSISTILIIF